MRCACRSEPPAPPNLPPGSRAPRRQSPGKAVRRLPHQNAPSASVLKHCIPEHPFTRPLCGKRPGCKPYQELLSEWRWLVGIALILAICCALWIALSIAGSRRVVVAGPASPSASPQYVGAEVCATLTRIRSSCGKRVIRCAGNAINQPCLMARSTIIMRAVRVPIRWCEHQRCVLWTLLRRQRKQVSLRLSLAIGFASYGSKQRACSPPYRMNPCLLLNRHTGRGPF
jgi:hypothetical protein